MMWMFKTLVCFYLLLLLHLSEGCRLKGNRDSISITAYTGGSVLLPCSCTDLHIKSQSVTWKKHINPNDWVEISPESEEYEDRFQLVNHQSPGNLSLLISHLTVEDGGDYRCKVTESEYRDIRLIVEGCTLNGKTVYVTGYVGYSVVLPCSCSELQAKPQTFAWEFQLNSDYEEIFPKDEENLYRNRVQLINDRPPGNLSLLISHLIVEDGGFYRCWISDNVFTYIKLAVEEATEKPAVKQDTDSDKTVIIISSGIAVVLLLLIVGGVFYWKCRGQRRRQITDGQNGQQDNTEAPNITATSEHFYETVYKPDDSAALYEECNPPPKRNKAGKKVHVTYSTVVHSNTPRAAPPPVASGGTAVYAIIKK